MMKTSCRLISWLIVLVLAVLASACTDGGDTDLPLEDDFSDPRSGWGVDQRDRFERGYAEGEYFVELREPNWFAWANPGLRLDDARVETDVYLASGSPNNHSGILCRYVDPGNFYYFAISADGYYAIFRRVDSGDLEVLTGGGEGMVSSPSIKTGGQVNRVVAVCQGDQLSLSVNGELLETVTDETHVEGDVGIGAGSGPEGDVGVRFDNFLVTLP